MSFFSKIGGWIKSAASVVSKVVHVVDDWLGGPSLGDTLTTLVRDMTTQAVRGDGHRTGEVMARLDAVEGGLRQQRDAARVLSLQSEVMQLAVSACAFDRYAANIRLHAANLAIHLQNIRNIRGLVYDVNGLRSGLKHAMRTINHMANLVNQAGIGKVDPLKGIDVERVQGAISLKAPCCAFKQSQALLAEELGMIRTLAGSCLQDVRRVQRRAASMGDQGGQVIRFLDDQVVPRLMRTKQVTRQLIDTLGALPALPAPEESLRAEGDWSPEADLTPSPVARQRHHAATSARPGREDQSALRTGRGPG